LQRYQQAADKSWSLTDRASFQVTEVERIQAALTHDQDFAQAGFEACAAGPGVKATPEAPRSNIPIDVFGSIQ
jgi:hypothetical protein